MLASWGRAGLLLGAAFGCIATAEDIITSDAYFYGESPPVYPSRTFWLKFPYLSLWVLTRG